MSESISEGDEQPKTIPALGAGETGRIRDFSGDEASAKEAQLFNSGESAAEIRKKAQENEAGRTERFRNHFETISIVALWGLFIIFSGLFLVWIEHLISPERYHFLDKTALDKLQLVVTGGFVTGIASSHIKKRLT